MHGIRKPRPLRGRGQARPGDRVAVQSWRRRQQFGASAVMPTTGQHHGIAFGTRQVVDAGLRRHDGRAVGVEAAAPSPSALARLDLSRAAGEVSRGDAPPACDLARAARSGRRRSSDRTLLRTRPGRGAAGRAAGGQGAAGGARRQQSLTCPTSPCARPARSAPSSRAGRKRWWTMHWRRCAPSRRKAGASMSPRRCAGPSGSSRWRPRWPTWAASGGSEQVTAALSDLAEAALDARQPRICCGPHTMPANCVLPDPDEPGTGRRVHGARHGQARRARTELFLRCGPRAAVRPGGANIHRTHRGRCQGRLRRAVCSRVGVADGGARRRRLRVPHRSAAAARSGGDPARRGGDRRHYLLREHGPELGARGDDQGAPGGRGSGVGGGVPGGDPAVRLAPRAGFLGGRRHPRHEAADQRPAKPLPPRRRERSARSAG